MPLLVSDANILIDMEKGGLLANMFSLDCRFIVPDILFVEELAERHAHMLELGLEQRSLTAETLLLAQEFARTYPLPSRNDLFALSLAKQEQCALLTGDKDLTKAARQEKVPVHGSLWLVEEMVFTNRITKKAAAAAYEAMRQSGSRLPWRLALDRLGKLADKE